MVFKGPPGNPQEAVTMAPPAKPGEAVAATSPEGRSSEDKTILFLPEEAPRAVTLGLTAEQAGRYVYRSSLAGAWTAQWSEGAVIGRGGQSLVRAAFDRHLGREVAMKELTPPRLDSRRASGSSTDADHPPPASPSAVTSLRRCW